MSSRDAVCAAANTAVNSISPGERVSLIWDTGAKAISFTFNHDASGWFWVGYNRTVGRTTGCGRAATIEAAVDQAWNETKMPLLAAE